MVTVPRTIVGSSYVNPSAFAKFMFYDYITLSGSWIGANADYRMNSLYDPRYALGGGQPSGLTQWASFYSAYTVYKMKIDVWFIRRIQTVSNWVVGVGPVSSGNTGAACDLDWALETPNIHFKIAGTPSFYGTAPPSVVPTMIYHVRFAFWWNCITSCLSC